jgi:hypothetical protein
MRRRNSEGRTAKYSYIRSRCTGGNGKRREVRTEIRCNTEPRTGQLWILKTVFLSTGIHQKDGQTDAKATAGCAFFTK